MVTRFTTSVAGVILTWYAYSPAPTAGAASATAFVKSRAPVTGSTAIPEKTNAANLKAFVFPSSAALIRIVIPPW